MSRHRTMGWVLKTSAGISLLLTITGCATMGGNVKGDFSCSAPDGICAPSSVIDDRALALISGDDLGPVTQPAKAGGNGEPRAAARPARFANGEAARTQERVLRIIIQPYIDDRGRLHEASTVRAVVAESEWRGERLAHDLNLTNDNLLGRAGQEALATTVDRLDPAIAAADPAAPDPAAVAAARAKAADPIAAIKADVAERLGAKDGEPTATRASSASPAKSLAAPDQAVDQYGRFLGSARAQPAKDAPAAAPAPSTAAGAEATVRAPAFPTAVPGEQ